MIEVNRWEIVYPDGSTELSEDEVLARSALQLAPGAMLRQRLVLLPAEYRLWDPAARKWVGKESYASVDKAAGDKLKYKGSQVRLVPKPTVPVEEPVSAGV